tara:strand:+ start:232 stop:603 length:372 start_codon:yes stop_codon:yes gene_type:complete
MGKAKDILIIGSLPLTISFLWMAWGSDPEEPEMSQAAQWEASARVACRDFISERLHDPSSAQWGMGSDHWFANWPATANDDGLVRVQPAFRASNALGATVASRWECEAQATDAGFSLVSLREG